MWKAVRIQTPLKRGPNRERISRQRIWQFGPKPAWPVDGLGVVQVTIYTRLILHSHVLFPELQAALELQRNFCEIQVVSVTVFQEEFLLEF